MVLTCNCYLSIWIVTASAVDKIYLVRVLFYTLLKICSCPSNIVRSTGTGKSVNMHRFGIVSWPACICRSSNKTVAGLNQNHKQSAWNQLSSFQGPKFVIAFNRLHLPVRLRLRMKVKENVTSFFSMWQKLYISVILPLPAVVHLCLREVNCNDLLTLVSREVSSAGTCKSTYQLLW